VVLGLAALAIYAANSFHNDPERGAKHSFSLLLGISLGLVMQRGRFCFFCIGRDYFQHGNSSGLYAILAALAVGGVGYTVIFGAFLPKPQLGLLPPEAHIGPATWVLAAAGLAFGLGMCLSGACISGHLYRLGEGYSRAPLALGGSLIGFGAGFFTWREVYLGTIAQAEVFWLPNEIGYAPSLAIHLAILGGLAYILLPYLPEQPAQEARKITPAGLYEAVFVNRWNPLVTGALVGLIGVAAYLRVEPLGVTSQLSGAARTFLQDQDLLADRLNGLDTLRGCAAVISHSLTENGLLILGLVGGSFCAALLGGKFQLSRLTLKNSFTALLGGVLMGWGSMLGLGCTVGTLLSGISAFALSGWVFGAAVFAGVWLGLKLKLAE
jgi:hypothetical protein